ncbi:hypothetical protein ACTMTF_42225 [Nonomuraea sp. ZG12]|uniref:hypothetical protein n=1 Tax=Nonomuraea sp. ZG12 TaxID=3452207 RepID=UPI003F8CCFCB
MSPAIRFSSRAFAMTGIVLPGALRVADRDREDSGDPDDDKQRKRIYKYFSY